MSDAKTSKNTREKLFKAVFSAIASNGGDKDNSDEKRSGAFDIGGIKDILGTIASIAGKGKDEVVQLLCREIGQAVAAMLKEPLTQVIENRKLRISLEFVPRNESDRTKGKASAKRKK
jgi:hypothetical protein